MNEKISLQVADHSIMDNYEIDNLLELLERALPLEGNIAELGVFKGGSSKALALFAPNKTVYCFDSFVGIQNATESDGVKNKRFDSTEAGFPLLAHVTEYLSDCPNVVILDGYFPDTTKSIINETFCFSHCDADTFQSAKDFIEFFYPRTTPGGFITFHDWSPSYTGLKVQNAVEQFLQDKPEKWFELPHHPDYQTKQAAIQKL